jgi:hypothetical protein
MSNDLMGYTGKDINLQTPGIIGGAMLGGAGAFQHVADQAQQRWNIQDLEKARIAAEAEKEARIQENQRTMQQQNIGASREMAQQRNATELAVGAGANESRRALAEMEARNALERERMQQTGAMERTQAQINAGSGLINAQMVHSSAEAQKLTSEANRDASILKWQQILADPDPSITPEEKDQAARAIDILKRPGTTTREALPYVFGKTTESGLIPKMRKDTGSVEFVEPPPPKTDTGTSKKPTFDTDQLSKFPALRQFISQ